MSLPFLLTMGHSRSASSRRMYTSKFMSWCCASRTAAMRTRVSSCRIACATGSPNSSRRRSPTGSQRGGAGPVKGRWLLGNGGYGLVANNQGIEVCWQRNHNAISGGRQVLRLSNNRRDGGGGGGCERAQRGWQVSFPIYITNMLKTLKARSKQAVS